MCSNAARGAGAPKPTCHHRRRQGRTISVLEGYFRRPLLSDHRGEPARRGVQADATWAERFQLANRPTSEGENHEANTRPGLLPTRCTAGLLRLGQFEPITLAEIPAVAPTGKERGASSLENPCDAQVARRARWDGCCTGSVGRLAGLPKFESLLARVTSFERGEQLSEI
jgi:hypothetical protein